MYRLQPSMACDINRAQHGVARACSLTQVRSRKMRGCRSWPEGPVPIKASAASGDFVVRVRAVVGVMVMTMAGRCYCRGRTHA